MSTLKKIFFFILIALCMVACQKDALEDIGTTSITQTTKTKVRKPIDHLSIQGAPLALQNVQRKNRQASISRSSKDLIFQDTGSVALEEYKSIAILDKMFLDTTCQYIAKLTPTSGDPDLFILGYNGTDFRTIADSEEEAMVVEELSITASDLEAGETHFVWAVYGYEPATFKIEIFADCTDPIEETIEEPTPPTHKQLNYLKRVYNDGYLAEEYIYDGLGRVVKSKYFNRKGQVRYYSVWGYDGNLSLVATKHFYRINDLNVSESDGMSIYEYGSIQELIRVKNFEEDGTIEYEEFYEYDAASTCSLVRQTYSEEGWIETLDYEYTDDRCSHILTKVDPSMEVPYKREFQYDGFNSPYESLNINNAILHNVKKEINFNFSKTTEYIYEYNEDGYPILQQVKDHNSETIYEYDITIPSPTDTTIVVPFHPTITSEQIARKVASRITWIVHEEEGKLEYDKTYDFSIEDNSGGSMHIKGSKRDYEKNTSSGNVVRKSRNENVTLEFEANNYHYRISDLTLQVKSGKIQYKRDYDYSSTVYITSNSPSRSSSIHKLFINATSLNVAFTDVEGVTYEDTIKVSIENVGSDNLKFYNMVLINSDGQKFEIKNLQLYN